MMDSKQCRDMANVLYSIADSRTVVTTRSLAEVANTMCVVADELDRLKAIEQAAMNLCKVKGRHHSEIAMKELMKACGVEK